MILMLMKVNTTKLMFPHQCMFLDLEVVLIKLILMFCFYFCEANSISIYAASISNTNHHLIIKNNQKKSCLVKVVFIRTGLAHRWQFIVIVLMLYFDLICTKITYLFKMIIYVFVFAFFFEDHDRLRIYPSGNTTLMLLTLSKRHLVGTKLPSI